MSWPPKIGEPLPRIESAWYEWTKVESWVLGEEGHGTEWSSVFHVGLSDWTFVWNTMLNAAKEVPITVVHDRSPFGFTCGVDVWLTVKDRSAQVALSLSYPNADSPPRLVTAYPNL